MKRHLRKVLLWAIAIIASVYGIILKGFTQWADYMTQVLTCYLIVIGLIGFVLWSLRYHALKRLERKGLLYLARVQERFDTTK